MFLVVLFAIRFSFIMIWSGKGNENKETFFWAVHEGNSGFNCGSGELRLRLHELVYF